MPLRTGRRRSPRRTGPSKEYLWTLNFGPQHPATHTTLRLILTLDGETVVKAVPDIGYLHSGFEKLGEHLDYNQYVTIVDRMNYISPVANEIAWHHAVEKLLGIELTPRCKYIRTIFAELMRIHDHLLCVGAAALDLGGFTAFLYAFNQHEKIYDICETASGPALPPQLHARRRPACATWTTTGSPRCATSSRTFPKAYADVCRLLNRNRIFIDRTKGIGVLSKEEAINLQLHRPGRPGQRRGPRPAQGRAVPGLQGLRFQGGLRRRRRLLRPLPGAHGGDAGEPQDHPPGHREPARAARSTSTSTARRCCPTSWRSTAASRG